jgi:hypothetical protein
MYLLAVRQHQALPGRDTPYDRHVVLFATAVRTGLSRRQRLWVGEAEPPGCLSGVCSIVVD